MTLRRFLRLIPKIELHVHLEGTIRRDLLRSIVRRNPMWDSTELEESLDMVYRQTPGLPAFLGRFKILSGFLRRPEDFYDAARRYSEELSGFGVLYAELHFSPQIFIRKGIPFPALMEAIHSAFEEADRQDGIRLRLILDGVRQWGPEAMRELVDLAEDARDWGVVGIGMGGDETAYPPEAFQAVFRLARERGWKTTVHAGEAAGADSVQAALEILRVDRIGHGVGARTDPDLLDRLADRRMVLDLCPTSQLRTGAVSGSEPYPAKSFVDRGIPVTISSDDPGLFSTDLLAELEWVKRSGGLSRKDLITVQRNALEGAFLSPQERQLLSCEFDRRLGEIWRKRPTRS